MAYYVLCNGITKFASVKDARMFAMANLTAGRQFDNLRVSNGWHPCIPVPTGNPPRSNDVPLVVLFDGRFLWYEGHGKLSAREMKAILPDGSLARRS